jgi:hypothetical protein
MSRRIDGHPAAKGYRGFASTATYGLVLNFDMQSHNNSTGEDFDSLSSKMSVTGSFADLSPEVTTDGADVKIECTGGPVPEVG